MISLPPAGSGSSVQPHTASERLDNLFEWVGSGPLLYPFFWVDPFEDDAAEHVHLAVKRGVRGFKVICDSFYPGDERALKVFKAIAATGRPILFHSGILWDGTTSSAYNRPAAFEALLEVDGLRFALAHASWPWCDELVAVYGKFLNSYSAPRPFSGEMFIDIAPGTPPIYRREVLTKLFTVGYDTSRNVIFGSDGNTADYNTAWVREWLERDNAIYRELGLSEEALSGIHGENLKCFVGDITGGSRPRTVKPAQ